MSSSRGLIDFAALEKELRGSVQSEEKYRRENAAKLRAVDQRVGSYEEFRSLVLASHLKPLERHDQQGAPRKQPWNPVTAGNRTHHTVTASYGTHHTVTAGNGTHDTVTAGNGTHDTVTAGNGTHDTVATGNRTHPTVTAGNGTRDTVAAGNGTEPMTPGSQEGNEENQK